MNEVGVVDNDAVNRLLNKSVKKAMEAGLCVLYCIGEKAEEQAQWQEVLKKQIESGLDGVDKSKVCIAYELDGKEIDYLPSNLEDVTPIYKTFKGWDNSVGIRKFEDLPATAQEYVKIIEEISNTKVAIISTSPERDDTIIL